MHIEKYDIEKFTSRKEKNEFPKAFKGIYMCSMCGAIYYKKAWHLKIKNHGKILEKYSIKKTLCPADKMIKNHQFEGEIKISNIPSKIRTYLINLIESFGERAYRKNNQHRIISVKTVKTRKHPSLHLKENENPYKKSYLSVTTTENQMTLQLAKKIHRAFKKIGKIKFSLSPQPSDVVYINIDFI